MIASEEQVTIAFEALAVEQRIRLLTPLQTTKNGWRFEFSVQVAQPNLEELPPEVRLGVHIPGSFPYGQVDIYSLTPELQGFPHQDAESHKLCLKDERLAPSGLERLQVYIDWALEWVSDAAQGKILVEGDPYELPDFSCKFLRYKPRYIKSLWFSESTKSFAKWKTLVGKAGRVELSEIPHSKVIFAQKFFDGETEFWSPSISASFLHGSRKIAGKWVLIPTLTVQRHRPAQTFGELRKLLAIAGIDFNALIKDLWLTSVSDCPFSVLMIGSPIPLRVGGEDAEVHWQPILFGNANAERSLAHIGPHKLHRKWKKLDIANRYAGQIRIAWGPCYNIDESRTLARGSFSPHVRRLKISLVGCGAVGSAVAELLIRSGASKLTLFDKEQFEEGNHSRHTLDGHYFGLNKAEALRMRLQLGSPHCDLTSLGIQVPNFDSAPGRMGFAELQLSDVIVDCSTSESAFQWLSLHTRRAGKTLVHLFTSINATFLTVVISGKDVSAALAFGNFLELLRSGQVNTLTAEEIGEYLREPNQEELVIPGAGCWHATFPARWDGILSLVSEAVRILGEKLSLPQGSSGLVVLLKHNPVTLKNHKRTSTIELACCEFLR